MSKGKDPARQQEQGSCTYTFTYIHIHGISGSSTLCTTHLKSFPSFLEVCVEIMVMVVLIAFPYSRYKKFGLFCPENTGSFKMHLWVTAPVGVIPWP